MDKENLSTKEIDNVLNNESGLYGISNVSKDVRDIEAAASNGNKNAILALNQYKYSVAGFIAKYVMAMQGVDVITFTGGVGENQCGIRADICKYLEYMGVKIDSQRNTVKGEEALISTDDSKVQVWVVPTNEELVIARDTLRLVNS